MLVSPLVRDRKERRTLDEVLFASVAVIIVAVPKLYISSTSEEMKMRGVRLVNAGEEAVLDVSKQLDMPRVDPKPAKTLQELTASS
jgi:hypothetical protein